MEIYKVLQITEADYGCEETDRKAPEACVKLQSETTSEVNYIDVPEAILAERGILEEKRVCFDKDGNLHKYVRVVAAVIREGDKIFATARGYGEYKGHWEFPGGKIEEGETPQEALIREIHEELAVEISVEDLIMTIEYDYPTFHLSMDCFWAKIEAGQIELKEAEAARWLTADKLSELDWLPADRKLVEKIIINSDAGQ
ncbi:MAG: (deoxy)nucleoside triphosphate pyrophosphohydrolase [Lachnospiraceae bacterium]|nr:(deoxy)nucleoside triphosphate pyrophosphohydrolase [Lachnospiraceae bacterium]